MIVSFGNDADLRLWSNGEFMLLAPIPYMVTEEGKPPVEGVVEKGFLTDLDSVPRFPPVIYALFKDVCRREAVLHDWLYVTQADRKWSDQVLLAAMKQNPDISSWKAYAIYWAVRIGGAGIYQRHSERELP